jgi:hypothetical protein
MAIEDTDAKTWKYRGEKLIVSWNYTKRLRTGETVQSATVAVFTSKNVDASSSILDGSPLVVTPVVGIVLKQNGGEVGKEYYIVFTANTQSEILIQRLALEVR